MDPLAANEDIAQLLKNTDDSTPGLDLRKAWSEYKYLLHLTLSANEKFTSGRHTIHNFEITDRDYEYYASLYNVIKTSDKETVKMEFHTLLFNAKIAGAYGKPNFTQTTITTNSYSERKADSNIKKVIEWAKGKGKQEVSDAQKEFTALLMTESELKDKKPEEFQGIYKESDVDCSKMPDSVVMQLIKESTSDLGSEVTEKAKQEYNELIRCREGLPKSDKQTTPICKRQDTSTAVPQPLRSDSIPSKSREERAKEEDQMRKTMCVRDNQDLSQPLQKGIQGDPEKILVSRKEWERVHKAEEIHKAQINELTLRLSSFASKQLIDGNPNIADLSDVNRPTKIGEKFGELYDNEWTDAFEELGETEMKEEEIIEKLLDIVKIAYNFSKTSSERQLKDLQYEMQQAVTHLSCTVGEKDYIVKEPKYDPKHLVSVHRHSKEFRKAAGLAIVPSLCVLFKHCKLKHEFPLKLNRDKQPGLDEFINRCVEYTWLMVIQDPPMCLMYAEKGEKVNTNQFSVYKYRGETVKQTVWPAIKLHKTGPLIKKGYVFPEK